MVDVHVIVTSSGPGLALIEVIALDSPGDPGIASIIVRDKFMVLLPDMSGNMIIPVSGCPHVADIRLPPAAGARFPITVAVSECHRPPCPDPRNPSCNNGPYYDPENTMGEPRELCTVLMDSPPSMACTTAQARIQPLRNAFRAACDTVHRDESLRDELAATAAATEAAFAALAAGAAAASATGFGAFLGILLFVAAIVMLALTIALFIALAVIATRAADERAQLSNAASVLEQALNAVRRICCPSHVSIDLTVPTC